MNETFYLRNDDKRKEDYERKSINDEDLLKSTVHLSTMWFFAISADIWITESSGFFSGTLAP